VTPACLQVLYRTISYIPSATSINRLGVTGYLVQYANDADLQVSVLELNHTGLEFIPQTFLKQFRPDAFGATVVHVQINGGLNNQSDPGLEVDPHILHSLSTCVLRSAL
jgi:tripeptidyl-peptidase-1